MCDCESCKQARQQSGKITIVDTSQQPVSFFSGLYDALYDAAILFLLFSAIFLLYKLYVLQVCFGTGC